MFTIGQQATIDALTDLYFREESIEPLRNEARGQMFDEFKGSADGFPPLDSFLKGSARLSAFESSGYPDHVIMKVSDIYLAGVRRQALIPFTFSDGLQVSIGDWMCVPHRYMMRDSQKFNNALNFDGFRFCRSCPGAAKNTAIPSKTPDIRKKGYE